ncbi:IgA receptor-like [Euwallacea similis]|uniref:IgA receptor-like n=1 Tax=Euwallacea similis TaxID=1736056 RepID=UPI003450F30C
MPLAWSNVPLLGSYGLHIGMIQNADILQYQMDLPGVPYACLTIHAATIVFHESLTRFVSTNRSEGALQKTTAQLVDEFRHMEKLIYENSLLKKDLEIQKLQKDVELQELQKDAELQKLQKDVELQELQKDAELQKLQKDAELQKLQKDAELQKLQKDAELQKLQKDAELQKLQKDAELQKLQKDAELQKVLNDAELQKILNDAELQKVRKDAEIQLLKKELQITIQMYEIKLEKLDSEIRRKNWEIFEQNKHITVRGFLNETQLKNFDRTLSSRYHQFREFASQHQESLKSWGFTVVRFADAASKLYSRMCEAAHPFFSTEQICCIPENYLHEIEWRILGFLWETYPLPLEKLRMEKHDREAGRGLAESPTIFPSLTLFLILMKTLEKLIGTGASSEFLSGSDYRSPDPSYKD